jgi:RNA polymerase sigma factor (TIGR02999 family)
VEPDSPTEVTAILRRLGEASRESAKDADLARLLEITYAELRSIAGALMRRERAGHTLQPTAVVHEAFLKLVGSAPPRLNDRTHFLAVAARAMRQVLVDHARRHLAERRGGGMQRITLDEALSPQLDRELMVLDLDRLLDAFATLDPRAAQVVEMRVFSGMTIPEIAAALGVSPRTVDGDWAMARAWLGRELKGGEAE